MNQPLPEGFIKRMQSHFEKDEFHSFIQSFDTPSWSSVRVNPRKHEDRICGYEQVPWCPQGFYLQKKPLYTLDPAFHAGAYYPQEASSMVLWHILKEIEDEAGQDLRILDLCGAPGGKSTLIASFLDGKGLLVANEVIQSRARILRENIIKWGAPNVVVTQSDPSVFSRLPGLFDVMVVDAPCSGEGMFRKGEVARKEWSEENTKHCAIRQRRILKDSWDALKEDGWLIYSTCTFNPDENEENLKWILQEKEAEISSLQVPDAWGATAIPVGQGNGLAFFPHRVKGEGFFVAIIRKRGSAGSLKKSHSEKTISKVPSVIERLVEAPESFSFFQRNQLWFAFPRKQADVLLRLQKHLYLLHAGIPLGMEGRKGFVPDHALALNWQLADGCFQEIQLSEDAALHYLKGESLVGDRDLSRGIFLVSCNRNRLGFVKNVGNRFNNLYPKEWRIRMSIEKSDE